MPEQTVHLFKLLMIASKRVIKMVVDSGGLGELTGPQFGVLRILQSHGPLTPSKISEIMIVSAANATELVTGLHKLKLVQRRRQASDRRSLRISLTSKGQDLLKNLLPVWEKEIFRCFSCLSPQEKLKLTALLDKFNQAGSAQPVHADQPDSNQGGQMPHPDRYPTDRHSCCARHHSQSKEQLNPSGFARTMFVSSAEK